MKHMSTRFVATALLVALLAPAQAEELRGRLFTSPEERAFLDYLRDDFLVRNQATGFDIEDTEIPEVPTDQAGPAGPQEFTLGGIMTRRDGSRTVWLNGQAIEERDLPRGMRIVSDAGVLALRLDSNNGRYLLRPGQTVEVLSGLVQEQYQRPGAQPAPEAPGTVPNATPPASPATEATSPPPAAPDATPAPAASPASADDPTAVPPTDQANAPAATIVSDLLVSGLPVGLPTANRDPATQDPDAVPGEPSQAEIDMDNRLTEILDAIQNLQDEIDERQ